MAAWPALRPALINLVIYGLDNRDRVYKCCLLLKIYPSKDAALVP